MTLPLALPLLLFALVGHGAMWVAGFNQLHALPLHCRLINAIEKVVYAITAAVPTIYVWRVWRDGGSWLPLTDSPPNLAWAGYFVICWAFALFVGLRWLSRRWARPDGGALLSNHSTFVNVQHEVGQQLARGWRTRLLARFPGNQIFELQVNQKEITVPRLNPSLDGLTIAHLSDLHFTGGIARPFFDTVCERVNAMDADLIVVTGDIVDKTPCVEWIPETLGRLRGRNGVFFVLGNHDKRVRSVSELRAALTRCNLVDVGGRWLVIQIRGQPILMAGNEAPWFRPVPSREQEPKPPSGEWPLRLLLSHSPDQIQWSRRCDFDLMLAGHNHGGQIRLPWIGPLIAPSRYGVKYASGLFYEPPTVLHVSRGVSGLHPIRLNCYPEITRLVLRCRSGSKG